MKPVIFANGLIFSDGFRFVGCIVVRGGMIESVDYGRIDIRSLNPDEYEIVDCEGKMVLPGVIDEHVHFRQPGMTEKGDIYTESRAAVAGGVTSFFDMPNTRPLTVTLEAWEEKMEIAAQSAAANYAFFIGVTNDNTDTLPNMDPTRVPGAKLFLGSSTGNMLVDNEEALRSFFEKYKGVIAVHAESEEIIARNRARLLEQYPGGIPVELHHLVRSREACVEASRKVIGLARATDARLHLLHVSTADELAFLTPGSPAEKRITAETCPHYLYFTHESVKETGGLTKCNPAIKEETDRRALLAALQEGLIDVVATDHAPHLIEQKQGDALTAASGMPSVKFSLVLMLQLARRGYFTYERVVEKMCNNPAIIFGVDRRGFLRPNYWADIVVVDPDCDYEITNHNVVSRCAWVPYVGTRLNFRVEQTWVNGALAFDYRRVAAAEGCTPQSPFTDAQTPLPVRFSRR